MSFKRFPVTPILNSLFISDGIWTESKAFSKSRNKMMQFNLFLFISLRLARSLKRYRVVDLPPV